MAQEPSPPEMNRGTPIAQLVSKAGHPASRTTDGGCVVKYDDSGRIRSSHERQRCS